MYVLTGGCTWLIVCFVTPVVAQWLEREFEFKPEDPGFDPLKGQGQGEGQVFFFCPSESALVQTCLCAR